MICLNYTALNELMAAKQVRVSVLAKACGLGSSCISSMRYGYLRAGIKTMRKLAKGLKDLGFTDAEIESVAIYPKTLDEALNWINPSHQHKNETGGGDEPIASHQSGDH